jgi:hypothetical protein
MRPLGDPDELDPADWRPYDYGVGSDRHNWMVGIYRHLPLVASFDIHRVYFGSLQFISLMAVSEQYKKDHIPQDDLVASFEMNNSAKSEE